MEAVSLEVLMDIYNRYLPADHPRTSHTDESRVVESTVTTLHFQSGLSLPVSGTSRTREQVLKKNRKAMKAVLESKTAASQALLPSSYPNAEQELLKHVRLIFPSALHVFDTTTFDAEIITLDPDFLSNVESFFLRVANTIIQNEQQQQTMNHKRTNNERVFLREQSYNDWPQWIKNCLTTSHSSISISSLLLAAMEVSIYKSYEYKHLSHNNNNKHDSPVGLLPIIHFHPLHHHVTKHQLPLLLQSWSRLHGLKNLSHGSAANVRQLVRQLISMSHTDQRQRGAMTAANSFHIDDLLLVSLPFFFFFTSFCDYTPQQPDNTTTNSHPADEPLQRWNGVIAQGKDYVTQLLKKLDLEDIALTKNSQKNIQDTNTKSANLMNVSAKEDIQTAKDNNNNPNEGESTNTTTTNNNETAAADFKNVSSSTTQQENSKQSSSKKKKKNKKKKVRS